MKHWQLFLLLVGPVLVFFMTTIMAGGFGVSMVMFPLAMLFFIAVFMGWLYTLGTSLHGKLPQGMHLSVKRFKVFLLFPAVYMAVFMLLFGYMFLVGLGNSTEPPFFLFFLIIPFHLFSMFCMFYTLYFCTKCLKAAELQRPVTFADYAGEFMLLWFFPIGIWILQPRINKLFTEPAQQPV